MNKRKKVQWHAPFCAATRLALRADARLFTFDEEHQLSIGSLSMDLLIIKKISEEEPANVIAKLFRKHNILEYKSPGDTLNIDTLFKTIAYASLYKSKGAHANERKAEDITITLIREKKPVKLFSILSKQYGIIIEEAYEGVYYLKGNTLFPTQFIETGRLREDENIWLRCLTRSAKSELVGTLVKQSDTLRLQSENEYADTVFSLMAQSNTTLFDKRKRETKEMTELMARYFLQDEIENYEAALADRDAVIADRDAVIAKTQADLAKNQADLAKKDKEIARLKAKLAARKR
ncbi:MAG: hypothetical protein IJP92_15420 [Lachnospiraceae bacterium]|nr:hypothetical protein [Lachnospiraceae bacterium]